jgi:DNA-binding IclR family transcriptional regulator
MARLGRLADPYAGAVARIQPILDEYADRFNETLTFVMVRGGTEHQVIAEAAGSRYLKSGQYLGGSYPLHASATGKVILAELNDDKVADVLPKRLESYTPHTLTRRDALLQELHQVREQGYAVIDDELEEGLFAAGCAVRDPAGVLIGVLTINGPTQRLKSNGLPETVGQLRRAADEIATALA